VRGFSFFYLTPLELWILFSWELPAEILLGKIYDREIDILSSFLKGVRDFDFIISSFLKKRPVPFFFLQEGFP